MDRKEVFLLSISDSPTIRMERSNVSVNCKCITATSTNQTIKVEPRLFQNSQAEAFIVIASSSEIFVQPIHFQKHQPKAS